MSATAGGVAGVLATMRKAELKATNPLNAAAMREAIRTVEALIVKARQLSADLEHSIVITAFNDPEAVPSEAHPIRVSLRELDAALAAIESAAPAGGGYLPEPSAIESTNQREGGRHDRDSGDSQQRAGGLDGRNGYGRCASAGTGGGAHGFGAVVLHDDTPDGNQDGNCPRCVVAAHVTDHATPAGGGGEELVAKLQRSLHDLGEHRQTHVVWRDWLLKDPANEQVNPHAGSAKFHDDTIKDYDRHLANIEEAIRRLASTGSDQSDEETALASYKRMFLAACDSLGRIAHDLGVAPDEGGHGPILAAIAELRASTGSAPAPSGWRPDYHTLRCWLFGIGVVGQIDGHEVIRRDSVVSLLERWLAAPQQG